MRAFEPALVAILALLVVAGAPMAPVTVTTAQASDTATGPVADASVPGPLRPTVPLVTVPDKAHPTAPTRAPQMATRRTPPPPAARTARAAPTAWSGVITPIRRGGDAKGKVVANLATHELKLTDFSVADRPNLEIWLTAAEPSAPAATQIEAKHVSLGRLKKPRGDQVYRFPAVLDLAVYRTVLVWSRRDRAPDAAARLNPNRLD